MKKLRYTTEDILKMLPSPESSLMQGVAKGIAFYLNKDLIKYEKELYEHWKKTNGRKFPSFFE